MLEGATAASISAATGIPPALTRFAVRNAAKHPKLAVGGLLLIAFWPVIPVFMVFLCLIAVVSVIGIGSGAPTITPSTTAAQEINSSVLALYQAVGNQDEVPWPIIAGIGYVQTENGALNPYTGQKSTRALPEVTPPIGGGTNQGLGPMLLLPSAADGLTHGQPQSMAASVDAIGSELSKLGQALALKDERQGVTDNGAAVDYDAMALGSLGDPTVQTFWETVISELPIEETGCTPPASEQQGTGSIPTEIESIWACELTGKTLYLQNGPSSTVDGGIAPEQLLAEAMQVAQTFSNNGAAGCNSSAAVAGVFPVPSEPGVDRCNPVQNIEEAAKLVIAQASKPVAKRTESEWSVLPGVVRTPAGAATKDGVAWSAAVPSSQACADAITTAISQLPEPGPFSPAYPGGPAPKNASSVWSASALDGLRTTTCAPTSGPAMTEKSWEVLVASELEESMSTAAVTTGGDPAVSTDASGLLTFLVKVAAIPTAAWGKTSIVPRLADPPATIAPIAASTPAPFGSSGFAAEAFSAATSFDAAITSTASLTAVATSGSIDGIPPGWVSWAVQAVVEARSTFASCALSPYLLLAIGGQESTWGTSTLPGVSSGANYAGAMGPMQFEPGTWQEYSSLPYHLPVQPPDVYNAEDALAAAANDLCSNGNPSDQYASAVFQYCGGGGGGAAAAQCDAYVSSAEKSAIAYAAAIGTTTATLTSYTIPSGSLGTFVSIAMQQLGTPYVWGGETQGSGFDCSGLVDFALLKAGVSIPGLDLGTNGSHGATAQQLYDATATHTVSQGQLAIGDLVFFGSSTSDLVHVGIYVGNGDMIDAPETGQNVQIQPYDWPSFVVATAV